MNGLKIDLNSSSTEKNIFGYEVTTSESKEVIAEVTYSKYLQSDNDIVLFNKDNNAYLISDHNWFFSEWSTDNFPLFFNIINTVRGTASSSNKIKFYDGHGGDYRIFNDSLSNMVSNIKSEVESRGFIFDSFHNEKPINVSGYRAIFILSPGRFINDESELFSINEIESIKSFVSSGGALILVSENNNSQEPFMIYQHTYNALLRDLGIEVEDLGGFYDSGSFKKENDDNIWTGFNTENFSLDWFSHYYIISNLDENKVLMSHDDNPVFIKAKIDD